MIRRVHSLDRDEITYRALLAFSIAFAFLQAFMAVRDMWVRVAVIVAQVSAVLS